MFLGDFLVLLQYIVLVEIVSSPFFFFFFFLYFKLKLFTMHYFSTIF